MALLPDPKTQKARNRITGVVTLLPFLLFAWVMASVIGQATHGFHVNPFSAVDQALTQEKGNQ